MVERPKAASYRVQGVSIGTDSPEINPGRIDHRVKTNTGHHVDAERLPERYRLSLSSLRKTAEFLDALEVVDNSGYDEERRPALLAEVGDEVPERPERVRLLVVEPRAAVGLREVLTGERGPR